MPTTRSQYIAIRAAVLASVAAGASSSMGARDLNLAGGILDSRRAAIRSDHWKHYAAFVAIVGVLLATLAMQKAPGLPLVTKREITPAPTADQSQAAHAERSIANQRRHDTEYAMRMAMNRDPGFLLKNITLTPSVSRTTRDLVERYQARGQIMVRNDRNAYRVGPDTSTLLADLGALRLQQRADLRSALTRTQRVQFDSNLAMAIARAKV